MRYTKILTWHTQSETGREREREKAREGEGEGERDRVHADPARGLKNSPQKAPPERYVGGV